MASASAATSTARVLPPQPLNWWRGKDSNLRRRKPADLQSAPVGRLGTPPQNEPRIVISEVRSVNASLARYLLGRGLFGRAPGGRAGGGGPRGGPGRAVEGARAPAAWSRRSSRSPSTLRTV